jgi:hypothetical protein
MGYFWKPLMLQIIIISPIFGPFCISCKTLSLFVRLPKTMEYVHANAVKYENPNTTYAFGCYRTRFFCVHQ